VEWRVSPHVVVRSREARVARRRVQLARYFEQAHSCSVSLRKMAIYDLDRLAVGALLACQDGEGFTLGLGVVEQADPLQGTIVVRTPLPDLAEAASLRFGAARWDLAGQKELM
jgi:hypothetical protein